jgi:hypothetical protein
VKLKAVIPQKRAEEPVWWCSQSPLIERHNGHHVPICRGREHRVLQHTASLEIYCCHKPILHEFLWVAWRNDGRSPFLLRHCSRWKGREHLRGPGTFSYFLLFGSLFFLSLFLFFRHREESMERTADRAKGYRGVQGQLLALNLVASMVKWLGPLRHNKGLVN